MFRSEAELSCEELLEVRGGGGGRVDAQLGKGDQFVPGEESRKQWGGRSEARISLGDTGGERWRDRDGER